MKKAVSWDMVRIDIVLTNVSEERIAYIFRVDEKRRKFASKETA
jgi:hypothetical protein